jgi:hypothetical protein
MLETVISSIETKEGTLLLLGIGMFIAFYCINKKIKNL